MNSSVELFLLIVGAVCYYEFIIKYLIGVTLKDFKKLKVLLNARARYKKKLKNLNDMKKRGEFHKWIDLRVNGKTYLVCEKTGWCPEIKGFFDIKYIQEQTSYDKKRKKIEDQLSSYKKEKMKDMIKRYNLSFNDLNNIVDEVLKIEEEFIYNISQI